LTPAEYLAHERQAEIKSEYWRGELYAMAGASPRHSLIAANIVTQLVLQLRKRSCTVHASDLRVKINASGLYTYPDVVVVCGRPQYEDREQDSLLNPSLIVEVLSPSTEAYDRGAKFAHYRTVESLVDYLVVAQDQPVVEHFVRQPGDHWLLTGYRVMAAVASILSLECQLPLDEVYAKVEWEEAGASAARILKLRDDDAMPYLAVAAWPGHPA
jgi:Uma2 family endonuclease